MHPYYYDYLADQHTALKSIKYLSVTKCMSLHRNATCAHSYCTSSVQSSHTTIYSIYSNLRYQVPAAAAAVLDANEPNKLPRPVPKLVRLVK